MSYSSISYIVFFIFFAYFIVITLFYFFLALVGFFESFKRKHESEKEDYPLFYLSTLTIPVSIIIPAHNEEEWIGDSLSSVLNLNYPKFEVIIVDDGSTDNTFKALDKILALRPIDISYVKHYRDGHIASIYKSTIHPNVTVIHKTVGQKKAGAVNAGLNFAKYDYVCSIDADTVLDPDSLLKVMAHVSRDPDKIIGVGSYFSLVNGLKVKDGKVIEKSYSYNPIIAYQNIEYIRSFIGTRIAWSKYNAMPTVSGGFAVWRKDVLYELGGFALDFTCEDLEFTFRAHDYAVKNKNKGYRILMLPYNVGWTEGPSNMKALISQRERWQRVTNETVWRYKYMLFNPRFGSFAFLALPYFLVYEVFGVFFEITSILIVASSWIAGILEVETFLAFLGLVILSQIFISLLSMFSFVRNYKLFSFKYTCYLIFLTFFEFLLYRWMILISKLCGMYRYFMRVRTHDRYLREKKIA